MDEGKPGWKFRALRCRCAAFAADFCRFVPLFQENCPAPAIRTRSAGPGEAHV
jgi:hypothetical protein